MIPKTLYWYDWEFDENGSTIIPISLGMVSSDNRELYLINNNYIDEVKAGDRHPKQWLMDNVLNHISDEDQLESGAPLHAFKDIVWEFISKNNEIKDRDEVELWGHFAAYDHVCLAQLWGPMINLPQPIPMVTHDDMTIRADQPWPERNVEEFPHHHALWDAKFQRYQWERWIWGE